MHRSHIPIQEWFLAAYLLSTHTAGISALQLQKQTQIGNYQNAWHLLHRLRNGMMNQDRTQLSGSIEVGETGIGGQINSKKGTGCTSGEVQSRVVGAIEVLDDPVKNAMPCKHTGRVRLSFIADASKNSLDEFVRETVEPGSRIVGSPHRCFHQSQKRTDPCLPHIHTFLENLKTWINETHRGVDPKHLPSYLNEYVFRYNNHHSPLPTLSSLLGLTVTKSPLTLDQLMTTPIRAPQPQSHKI
jgi:hypothetical protein